MHGIHLTVFKAVHLLPKRRKIVTHGLSEDVPVGEEKDALYRARLQQPPDDLECYQCLACACGKDDQHTPVAAGNGRQDAVDGNPLVIARFVVAFFIMVGDGKHLLLLVGKIALGPVTLP